MTNWHEYWNMVPKKLGETEFARQVERTVNGTPIPEHSFNIIAQDAVQKLRITKQHRVLDVCCGNGMVTYRCAPCCKHITGIDFSERLIAIAKRFFRQKNVAYEVVDARCLDKWLKGWKFDRIMLHACLQHFTMDETGQLLSALRRSESGEAQVYITSIPDRERLWSFYNTPERQQEYQRRVREGTEAIGTWWLRDELGATAATAGYRVEVFEQHPDLDGAHYRFDALLYPLHEVGRKDVQP